MRKRKFLFVLLLLLSITVVSTCSTFFYVKLNNVDYRTDEFLVMTSCNPIYIATTNVVGDTDGVAVQNLSQPTTGCLHDYTLTTEDMKNLSKADVLVVNGGGMEGYLEDVMEAYPELTIIDTYECLEHDSSYYDLHFVEENDEEILEDEHLEEEHTEEEHSEEGHHHDHEQNSHIWMDSEMFAVQVQVIADGLSELDASNASSYEKNASDYIDVLNTKIDKQELEQKLSGDNVAILHEAFEYTALSLGANVVATLDLDEERQVSAGEVSQLIDSIRDNNVRIVFAEYDYGKSVGDLIEEQTDAKVVYLETLVHGSYGASDYVTTMNDNYLKISNSL